MPLGDASDVAHVASGLTKSALSKPLSPPSVIVVDSGRDDEVGVDDDGVFPLRRKVFEQTGQGIGDRVIMIEGLTEHVPMAHQISNGHGQQTWLQQRRGGGVDDDRAGAWLHG